MWRSSLRAVWLLSPLRSYHLLPRTSPSDERSVSLLRRFYAIHHTSHHHTTSGSSDEDDSGEGAKTAALWDESCRKKAARVLFGGGALPGEEQDHRPPRRRRHEGGEDERSDRLARELLDASLTQPDGSEDEEGDGSDVPVRTEDQRSLHIGIVGAPNAGKSSLTNAMAGSKVAAVSRKTNTTTHEMLGKLTQGDTQICIFDTPGITLGIRGHPQKSDVKARVDSAWKSIDQYDLLVVVFDVHRHLTMGQDQRVVKLINYLGKEAHPTQKRVLCMNKVDLVIDKKSLLEAAEEFKDLPGYDRYFMVSCLKDYGVKDLVKYLRDQAVKRPWVEVCDIMSEEITKDRSLDIIREKILNHIHQEVPYVLEYRLMGWKELKDGSLMIQYDILAQRSSQARLLVGKKGSKIGRIQTEAMEELRSMLNRDVHLLLQVKVAKKHGA